MTIKEIIVALQEIDFDALSDQELSNISDVLKSSSSKATQIAYFRKRKSSSYDPDVMAAAD